MASAASPSTLQEGMSWRRPNLCREWAAKMQMQLKAVRQFISGLPVVCLTR